MAGWRARDDEGGGGGGGGGSTGEPIELVDDGDRSEVEVAEGRTIDWHAVLRTGAAVVAALALVWMGRSWADERTWQRRQQCRSDLQEAMWRWEEAVNLRSVGSGPSGPDFPDDVVAEFAERAEACGDDLITRAVAYRFSEAPDDD